MFILPKVNFRRFFIVCLVSAVLFIGSTSAIGHQDIAFAEVIEAERDAVVISPRKPLSDTEYESAKASRNQVQAELSKKAEDEAKAKAESESVAEKLNLNEIVSPTDK